MQNKLENRLGAEVGPRGGKIIGKTKTGKPIYENFDHPSHSNFSKSDHDDASKIHHMFEGEAQKHLDRFPHNDAQKSRSDFHRKQRVQHSQGAPMSKGIVPMPPHVHHEMHPEVSSNTITMPIPKPHQSKNPPLPKVSSLEEKMAEIENRISNEVGPRGGKIIGKTSTGKPIYMSHGNRNHKGFSKVDHEDAVRHHSWLASKAGEDYHAQGNRDGTISDKGMRNQKHLKKVMDHHRAQAHAHLGSAQGTKRAPDQRDFDRMDRQNDPDKRSLSWKNVKSGIEELEKRMADVGARGGKIIGKTKSGKPIYESYNHHAHKGFTSEDHEDAARHHAHHAENSLGKNNKAVKHHTDQMHRHIEHYYHGGAQDFSNQTTH